MKILGMGGFEFVIILIVVLLIFGPKNLPKLGKAFGKTVSNLRDGMNEGKKKEGDEAAEEEVAAEAEEPSKPAEIEGEVEEAPAAVDDADAADVVDASDTADTVDEPPAVAGEDFDAQAAVDEVFETKKVRRVVKKKVVSEEAE